MPANVSVSINYLIFREAARFNSEKELRDIKLYLEKFGMSVDSLKNSFENGKLEIINIPKSTYKNPIDDHKSFNIKISKTKTNGESQNKINDEYNTLKGKHSISNLR